MVKITLSCEPLGSWVDEELALTCSVNWTHEHWQMEHTLRPWDPRACCRVGYPKNTVQPVLHFQRQRKLKFNRNVNISELTAQTPGSVLAAVKQADRCTYGKADGQISVWFWSFKVDRKL